MAQTSWMLVSAPDNFERSRAQGFPMLGMKSRHRKKAEKVQPGDRVLFYCTGVMAFAGTFTVRSTYYEDHSPVWVSSKPGEDYPFRFDVRPDVVLDPAIYVRAETLLSDLEWVKKWPIEHWHLAFQGNVHVLPIDDFATIERALEARRTAVVAR